MKNLIDAISAGVDASATQLTYSLYSACQEEGWSEDAMAGVAVSSTKSGMKTILKVTTSKKAQDEEYGNGLTTEPKPAVRRWSSRSKDYESIILDSVEQSLGGIL